MGTSVFSCFIDFKVVILIISIMKLFAFRILGVAMLMLCAFAAPLSEERRGKRSIDPGFHSHGGEKRGDTNIIREGKRGQTEEMQRGWHPTGKVLGNVIGGVVGKLRGDGNEMEREECQNGHCIPTRNENLMQNGPGGEEERRGGNENLMQNAGEEKRGINEMQNAGGEKRGINEMQNGPGGEEERRHNDCCDQQQCPC